MNNTLIKQDLQAKALKPSSLQTIVKLDITITNRKSAINLMTLLEKVWKTETFAVLPADNNEWRLCNYNLLDKADKKFIDEARGYEGYYC
jgi:hypothetical protein